MKILMKIILLNLFCTFFILDYTLASNSKDIAIILKSKGAVKVHVANQRKWRKANRGMHLNSGDVIKTGDNSLVAIMFTDDKSLLKIRENSTLSIKGKRTKSTVAKRLKLALGQIWVKVKKQEADFRVATPSGTAVVKGTEFYHFVDEDGNSMVIGIEGMVWLKNKLGEILIKAGETGLATKLTAPTSQKTDNSQVPDWGKENDFEKYLEFEFEDSEGNKKVLKIKYEGN